MIPNQIEVAGIKYIVEELPFIEINQNRNYMGLCSYDQTKIQVITSISDDRKRETFVHELTHAIMNEAGFHLTEERGPHTEEAVERIGKVLFQVLRDNDFSWFKK
jgi:Zn-dependent peptidase ImmA (M78 family)